jgi:hypothetical protein
MEVSAIAQESDAVIIKNGRPVFAVSLTRPAT